MKKRPCTFCSGEMDVLKIKSLAAAYQAALEYDYCPSSNEAALLPDEIDTSFSVEDFERGAEENEGRRPDEIAKLLVIAIGKIQS